MDKFANILALAVPLLVMLALGALFRRKKIISPQGISDIKAIIINICLPAVIFTAFTNAPYNADTAVTTVVIFSALLAALFLGFLFKKLLKIKKESMPFINTGVEAGMMGYALFTLLFGAQNLGAFAVIDFGQELFIFTVFITLLSLKNDGNYTMKKAVKNILTTPPFIAIIAGIAVSASGLGRMLDATAAGSVILSTISFMSAPISMLILLVIGYGIEFSRPNLKGSLQSILLRLLTLFALYLATRAILGAIMPVSALTDWALLLFFILPPPFVTPIFIRKQDEQGYLSTTLSIYSLLSIAAFIIIAVFAVKP